MNWLVAVKVSQTVLLLAAIYFGLEWWEKPIRKANAFAQHVRARAVYQSDREEQPRSYDPTRSEGPHALAPWLRRSV